MHISKAQLAVRLFSASTVELHHFWASFWHVNLPHHPGGHHRRTLAQSHARHCSPLHSSAHSSLCHLSTCFRVAWNVQLAHLRRLPHASHW